MNERHIEEYKHHDIYQNLTTGEYNTIILTIGQCVADTIFNMRELIDENIKG